MNFELHLNALICKFIRRKIKLRNTSYLQDIFFRSLLWSTEIMRCKSLFLFLSSSFSCVHVQLIENCFFFELFILETRLNILNWKEKCVGFQNDILFLTVLFHLFTFLFIFKPLIESCTLISNIFFGSFRNIYLFSVFFSCLIYIIGYLNFLKAVWHLILEVLNHSLIT
jgi:hypothetical protein